MRQAERRAVRPAKSGEHAIHIDEADPEHDCRGDGEAETVVDEAGGEGERLEALFEDRPAHALGEIEAA